jgi:pimeloyl-ACP methyl ester carboxylesterase
MAMKIERRIDVTEAAALGEPVEMAVTIFLPEWERMPDRPLAIFAVPGGGYSRGYFDLSFDAHQNYSQADFHTDRGTIFIAIDHVGVGESTIPDLARISFQTFAATQDACVRQLAAELEAGSLTEGFPACSNLFKIGMGQSMGGAVALLAQGRFATFDAIAPCGVSAIQTVLPQRDEEAFERGKQRFSGVRVGDNAQSHETVTHQGVDYLYAFHWEDVPADILAEDMKGGYPLRRTAPNFGSVTIPHCAVQMMTPGCFTEDAARITVPVFIGNGERDTCPDPHAEPSAYRASQDVTVFIVPTMAHMHNFASTRALLWERLEYWARGLASSASPT